MPDTSLEPLAPADALDWYLEHRHDELRAATRRKHRSALGIFVEWTDHADLDNLNALRGRDLMRFKTWRKRQTDVNVVSLNGTLAILQRFLRFCETIDAVPEGLVEKVPVPNVPPEEAVSTWVPDDEVVDQLQSYFRLYEYASRRHTEFELVAEVGLRLGAVRAIDLQDVELEEQVIRLRHRPEGSDEYGTPLKNGGDGERLVNISDGLAALIGDYQQHHREEVTDQYGRDPLFTTRAGRVSRTTVRCDFYKMTRPCVYGTACPHDRDEQTCEAADAPAASKCPSSFSTHPLRKWAIMTQLDAGVPKELLSDRVDVSVPVLDKHYDQRTEAQKSRRRREVLERCLDGY